MGKASDASQYIKPALARNTQTNVRLVTQVVTYETSTQVVIYETSTQAVTYETSTQAVTYETSTQAVTYETSNVYIFSKLVTPELNPTEFYFPDTFFSSYLEVA